MDRRSFFGIAAATSIWRPPAVKVSDEMQLSDPSCVRICWSGWRAQIDNNRLSAWYTAHLPVLARDPVPPGPVLPGVSFPGWERGYKHFCSMVLSSKNSEEYRTRVGGYDPGCSFNTTGTIIIEENEEAMSAQSRSDFGDVLDRVFAVEKKRALDALVEYMGKLEPVEVT